MRASESRQNFSRSAGAFVLAFGALRLGFSAVLWASVPDGPSHSIAVKLAQAVASSFTIVACTAAVVGFGLLCHRSWSVVVGLTAGFVGCKDAAIYLSFRRNDPSEWTILGHPVLQLVSVADLVVLASAGLLVLVFRPRTPGPRPFAPRVTVASQFVGVSLITIGTTMASAGMEQVFKLLGMSPGSRELSDLISKQIYVSFIGLFVSMLLIAAGIGVALRRDWGRQLAGVLSAYEIYATTYQILQLLPRLSANADPRDYVIIALKVLFACLYAAAFVYVWLQPRPRSPRPQVPVDPPPPVASTIRRDGDWQAALVASLRDASSQSTPATTPLQGLLVVCAFVLVMSAWRAVDILLTRGLSGAMSEARLFLGVLWAIVGTVAVARLAGWLWRELGRRGARSAEAELQRHSSRRPVLYLRSFALDEELGRPTLSELLLGRLPTANAEQRLVRTLRPVGPTIAIGRPGERLPALGAARFYAAGDRWHLKVADVVAVARLVVWATGTSEGLRWEISHLVAHAPPDRLILWAHSHLLNMGAAEREAEWTRFRTTLGSAFPRALPERLGRARFFHFDDNWEPVPVAAWRPWWAVLVLWPRGAQASALRRVLTEKGIVGGRPPNSRR